MSKHFPNKVLSWFAKKVPRHHHTHTPSEESGGLDNKSVVEFINEEAAPVRGQWPSVEAIADNQGEDTMMDETSPLGPCVHPPPKPASLPFHLNPAAPFKKELYHSSRAQSKTNRPCWDKNGQSAAAFQARTLKYQQPPIKAGEAISEITVWH